MGKVIVAICFTIGIPIFLFGALIFTGLSIAGIIGSSIMIPAIIFASALLLIGAFLMFMGWRNMQEKKVVTVKAGGQTPSDTKASVAKKPLSIARILAIVVVAVVLISAIAISVAVIVVPLLNQMSSDTDTDVTSAVNTDSTKTVTNPTNARTMIAMKNSDFGPEDARVPLNHDIVWINDEDDPPHTATSGTSSNDPNSGKIFDTGIIDGGDQSTPLRLSGVKVGDEIPYYCMVHPSMTGKLIVTAPN